MEGLGEIVKRYGYWRAIVAALVVLSVPPIIVHYATNRRPQPGEMPPYRATPREGRGAQELPPGSGPPEGRRTASPEKPVAVISATQPIVLSAAEVKAPPAPFVRDLGSFTLDKAGKTWRVEIPAQFLKVEVAFYRETPDDQTLNAAWDGLLRINGRDTIHFVEGLRGNPPIFRFRDEAGDREYSEVNDYRKTSQKPFIDVTRFVKGGLNTVFYYHEQRVDLPMGVLLRITPP